VDQLLVPDETWHNAEAGTIAGALAMRDVANPRHHAAIDKLATDLEAELRARYAGQDRAAIQATSPLPAYATYYRRFGQRYHVGMQLESVALKGKPLPRVAALVEAMFIAELRHGILTAGHDLDAITTPIRLGVGTGAESFVAPNGDTAMVKAGDVFTATADGVLSAIITGPSALARIAAATTAVLFVAYAPPGVPRDLVESHLDEIGANVREISPQAIPAGRSVTFAGAT
jgi:DNA/RNA-binding domain of Phe-tRNA-synthetase-like protein